jgi:predicted acylesterase/phospholipase RssA
MKYDLVLEGGGAKGLVFVGALQEFEAREHEFGRLLGTSAGAIMATLLAAGYSAAELQESLQRRVDGRPVFDTFLGQPEAFNKVEIQHSAMRALFRDVDVPMAPGFVEDRIDDALVSALLRFPLHRNLMALLERGGWYSAAGFETWLNDMLQAGTFHGRPRRFGKATLAEFFNATGVSLSLVAADTTAGRMRVLNHKTAPQCPVLWAVRMSMNLPLVWPEVIWREEWGKYLGRSVTGNSFVDGGVLSSFPLELFVSDEPYVVALMGPASGDTVLGLLIDEALAATDEDGAEGPPVGGVSLASLRVLQRMGRLLDTVLNARDLMVIDAYQPLVARLPAKGYKTLEFDMDDRRRERLITGGRAAMKQWFDRPRPQSEVELEGAAIGAAQSRANRVARELLQP